MNTIKRVGKKITSKFRKMSKVKRLELVLALVLTIILCISIPMYAWFTNQRKLAELAKIKAPDELYINAAHKEDIINLDMTSVDVTKKYSTTENNVVTEHDITSQSFVFSVSGEWVNSYTLQIEHTTNNPFTYTICEGKIYQSIEDMKAANPAGYAENELDKYEERNADGSFKYVEYTATNIYDAEETSKITNWPQTLGDVADITSGKKYYVWIGNEITNKQGQHGSYLNKTENGRYANVTYVDKSYETGTYYQRYANPLFWQLKNIKASDTKSPFYNTYVIKVDWTGVNNIATDYKKETDIFYISAFVE